MTHIILKASVVHDYLYTIGNTKLVKLKNRPYSQTNNCAVVCVFLIYVDLVEVVRLTILTPLKHNNKWQGCY